MIEITHIKWGGRKIGIALRKLKPGTNEVKITAKDKSGNLYYPNSFFIDRDAAIDKYGVEVINNNNLAGVWVPLSDIQSEPVTPTRSW